MWARGELLVLCFWSAINLIRALVTCRRRITLEKGCMWGIYNNCQRGRREGRSKACRQQERATQQQRARFQTVRGVGNKYSCIHTPWHNVHQGLGLGGCCCRCRLHITNRSVPTSRWEARLTAVSSRSVTQQPRQKRGKNRGKMKIKHRKQKKLLPKQKPSHVRWAFLLWCSIFLSKAK